MTEIKFSSENFNKHFDLLDWISVSFADDLTMLTYVLYTPISLTVSWYRDTKIYINQNAKLICVCGLNFIYTDIYTTNIFKINSN